MFLFVWLLLLGLVGCFRLLPLNHAAAHDAVETPQVEEGDGAKQPHGDDLGGKSKGDVRREIWGRLERGLERGAEPAGDPQ